MISWYPAANWIGEWMMVVPGGASRCHGALGVRDHPGRLHRLHRLLDGAVQGTTVAREVVLVLDENDSGLRGIHGFLPGCNTFLAPRGAGEPLRVF